MASEDRVILFGIAFIFLIVGGLIGWGLTSAYYSKDDGSPTGRAICPPQTCPEFKCEKINRQANYEIMGKTEDTGSTSINAGIKTKIKNIDTETAKYNVKASCNTAENSDILISEGVYLEPGQEKEVEIKYRVGLFENWKCVVSGVESETISTCNLVEI